MKTYISLITVTVGLLSPCMNLLAQEEEKTNESTPTEVVSDPFAPTEMESNDEQTQKILDQRSSEKPVAFRLRLEIWELDTKQFALQLDDVKPGSNFNAWRDASLASDAAALLNTPAVRVETGTKSTVESILEHIYPTEYEPPVGDKNGSSPAADALPMPQWAAVPTAFETRNTGTTLEAVVRSVSGKTKTWDIWLSLESVKLEGDSEYGFPLMGIKMPDFSSYRAGGILRLQEGAWQLLSAQSAPPNADGSPTGKTRVAIVRLDRVR